MENMLSGKTAIITGASRGIGKTIAIALGREKMRLALLARSTHKLQEVANEVHAVGGETMAVPCDLLNPEAIDTSLKRIFQHFNSLDVLISNAGIFLEKPITEIKMEEWDRVLGTNLTATFLLCQKAFIKMKGQKSGRIIAIASSASTQGYIHQAAYCASKHGLLGFTRCLSIEARPYNVHVLFLIRQPENVDIPEINLKRFAV